MWSKDEVTGKRKQIQGRVKKAVGSLTNDVTLEKEGQADQDEGKVQETVGRVRRKVGDAVTDISKAITGK
ncbi:MAG: CsbD family protein [Acidobacteria bacterium]|nr:CsbD family protein [Acidobacteriota bacterium]